ncbi:MAG: hypothetical protein AAFW60_07230, partial [Pseudomonadota bacterium]
LFSDHYASRNLWRYLLLKRTLCEALLIIRVNFNLTSIFMMESALVTAAWELLSVVERLRVRIEDQV